jgi:hypothetical protein
MAEGIQNCRWGTFEDEAGGTTFEICLFLLKTTSKNAPKLHISILIKNFY